MLIKQLLISTLVLADILLNSSARDCLNALSNCTAPQSKCLREIRAYEDFCGNWEEENTMIGCKEGYTESCANAFKDLKSSRPELDSCDCTNMPNQSILSLRQCNRLSNVLKEHPCLKDPPIFLKKSPTSFDQNRELYSNSLQTPSQEDPIEVKNQRSEQLITERFVETWSKADLRRLLRDAFRITDDYVSQGSTGQLCNKLISNCQLNSQCEMELRRFYNGCLNCDLKNNFVECRNIYRKLNEYSSGLDSCVCSKELINEDQKRQCFRYQNDFLDNSCIAENAPLPAIDNLVSEDSCYNVYQDCLKYPTCLIKYQKMKQSCETQSCFNPYNCQNAVREFYSSVTDQVLNARALVCGCSGIQVDQECHHQQDIFRPSCSKKSNMYQSLSEPHCIQTLFDCSKDTSCRLAYNEFVRHCITKNCSSASKCWKSYLKLWTSNHAVLDCKCETNFRIQLNTNRVYLSPSLDFNASQIALCKSIHGATQIPRCLISHHYASVQNHGKYRSKPHELACDIRNKFKLPIDSFIRIYKKADFDPNISLYFRDSNTVTCSIVVSCDREASRLIPCNLIPLNIRLCPHESKSYILNKQLYLCYNGSLIAERKKKSNSIQLSEQLVVNYDATTHEALMNAHKIIRQSTLKTNLRQKLMELAKDVDSAVKQLIGSKERCSFVLNEASPSGTQSQLILRFSVFAHSNPIEREVINSVEYCENVLKIILTAINEQPQQPWVRYNSHLSVLYSASLETLLPMNINLQMMAENLNEMPADESLDQFEMNLETRRTRNQNQKHMSLTKSNSAQNLFAKMPIWLKILIEATVIFYVQF